MLLAAFLRDLLHMLLRMSLRVFSRVLTRVLTRVPCSLRTRVDICDVLLFLWRVFSLHAFFHAMRSLAGCSWRIFVSRLLFFTRVIATLRTYILVLVLGPNYCDKRFLAIFVGRPKVITCITGQDIVDISGLRNNSSRKSSNRVFF